MDIVYFEYYPHRYDTLSARLTLSEEQLTELLATYQLEFPDREIGDDDHPYTSYYDKLQEDNNETLFALDLLADEFGGDKVEAVNAILKSLDKKGWYLGEWEEGSFYFALPECEHKAQQALTSREAEVLMADIF